MKALVPLALSLSLWAASALGAHAQAITMTQITAPTLAPLQDRLAGAAAHICAYAGSSSDECSVAKQGRVSWFDPRVTSTGFEATGWFDPPNRISLADTLATPASMGALYIHEITHLLDYRHGACCAPPQCMGTERHAYTVEYTYWRWVKATFGRPSNEYGDNLTPALNQYLLGDLTDRIEASARASCANAH